MRRLNEPSHLELRCLTFSLSTLHINVFPKEVCKTKKADDKCRLKFGAERVNTLCETDVITSSIWTDRPIQTVKTQIRRRRTRRLIRVYTVCHSSSNISNASAGSRTDLLLNFGTRMVRSWGVPILILLRHFHLEILLMTQLTTKPTLRPVWPANIRISLYIHPAWQGFSFIRLWIDRWL